MLICPIRRKQLLGSALTKQLMNLILNILKSVPLFAGLSEEHHETIIQHITLQYYPVQHKLFEQGVLGSAMYIIKSGKVRIFNEGGDLATLGAGDFFGEMALIEDQARNASAQTLSECEIFLLKKEDFKRLIQNTPDLAQKVQMAYTKRKSENA
jgi:CRP-like cAMP-binding protein